MSSAFDVTVVPTSLQLTAGQAGELELTVSNRSGRGLTARAIPNAEPKAALGWLTARDQDEAPLAAGETRKIRYGVKVPPDAAAQKVTFRVDVADVTDPNQFYAQGPAIAVTVAARVITKDPWWKKWWPYAAAAAAVLIVGFVIYLVVKPKGGVPNVVHMTFDSAQVALRKAGLSAQRTDSLTSDTAGFKAGVVFLQLPESGKPLPKDKKVTVSVQKAWAVVPAFAVNGPFAPVGASISSRGLLINARTQYNGNAALNGMVQSLTPGPGTVLARGDAVTVTLWTNVASCGTPWQCMVAGMANNIQRYNLQARQYAAPVRP